ncbi:MAG: 50S ribosomal protein L9 [Spirochaetales bacterium]
MKVILNTDVSNLGEEGDVCEVKPGYARNYLLPRNLVLLDNRANRALIDARRAEIEERKQKKQREAQSLRERIENEPMVVEMPAGENGKLFGSLSSAGIAERLEKAGIDVQRRQIDVPEKTIKTVGNFKVRVRLYGEEEATLTVTVTAAGRKGADSAQSENSGTTEATQGESETAVEEPVNGAGESATTTAEGEDEQTEG